jgi:hypothetical protein
MGMDKSDVIQQCTIRLVDLRIPRQPGKAWVRTRGWIPLPTMGRHQAPGGMMEWKPIAFNVDTEGMVGGYGQAPDDSDEDCFTRETVSELVQWGCGICI